VGNSPTLRDQVSGTDNYTIAVFQSSFSSFSSLATQAFTTY